MLEQNLSTHPSVCPSGQFTGVGVSEPNSSLLPAEVRMRPLLSYVKGQGAQKGETVLCHLPADWLAEGRFVKWLVTGLGCGAHDP